VKVYTIGVGTEGKAPFLVDTFFGKRFVWQEVDLDEETLQMIARQTKGKFFRATNTEALEEIYKEIDALEKTEVKVKEYMEYNELFIWFVFIGLGLIVLEIFLANTRFLKIP
jgi:Ca-activated chloride channel family protein